MLRRKGAGKEPKVAGRPPGRPRAEPPVDNVDALRTLGEQLSVSIDAYASAKTAVGTAEATLIQNILEALGTRAAAFLCDLPERAVSPHGQTAEPYVVLVTRARDNIALWQDCTLALVPFDESGEQPVHFRSVQDFVEAVGVGFARPIAVALGIQLKRANAKLPGLTADLTEYGETLPGEEPEKPTEEE